MLHKELRRDSAGLSVNVFSQKLSLSQEGFEKKAKLGTVLWKKRSRGVNLFKYYLFFPPLVKDLTHIPVFSGFDIML